MGRGVERVGGNWEEVKGERWDCARREIGGERWWRRGETDGRRCWVGRGEEAEEVITAASRRLSFFSVLSADSSSIALLL